MSDTEIGSMISPGVLGVFHRTPNGLTRGDLRVMSIHVDPAGDGGRQLLIMPENGGGVCIKLDAAAAAHLAGLLTGIQDPAA